MSREVTYEPRPAVDRCAQHHRSGGGGDRGGHEVVSAERVPWLWMRQAAWELREADTQRLIGHPVKKRFGQLGMFTGWVRDVVDHSGEQRGEGSSSASDTDSWFSIECVTHSDLTAACSGTVCLSSCQPPLTTTTPCAQILGR